MPFNITDPFSTLPLETGQIAVNLIVALVCGLSVSLIYRWTYRGTSYSATFVSSLITLAMITAVVIMAIGNNLARAFGLVGAMSIIRFRTAVKDTQDLVFIFLALSIGLAAGVGFHRLAILATVIVGGVLLVLGHSGFGTSRRREYLVEITATSSSQDDELPPWDGILARFARRHRLLHARSSDDGRLDLGYLVALRDTKDAPILTDALGQAKGVEKVALYFDEDRPL